MVKRFFVGLAKVMGKIGTVAIPEIARAYNPALGGLADLVVNSILQAEATHGPGAGEAKMNTALSNIDTATPLILRLLESSTGRDLADDALFAQGVHKLADGYVDVMNALKVLPKKE